jgi:hypothetical protein
MLVTLIVGADSIDEIGIEHVESGIRLRFEAQSGDGFFKGNGRREGLCDP